MFATTSYVDISIHAPRTGSDCEARTTSISGCYFNPRSPHGERRIHSAAGFSGWGYFNPRSPHGERQAGHSPAEWRNPYFNPRSPHGERHAVAHGWSHGRKISIHAPRTGSDVARAETPQGVGDFNPRSPHGERQTGSSRSREAAKFQSTLPARGATARARR